MKYYCSNCGYVYDEILGDLDLGIKPYTYFDSLSSEFFCPICDTHKDDFVVLEEYINYPINPNNLLKIEKQHYPIFEIKDEVLIYQIGQIEHPNEEGHFIYKVSLFDDSGNEILKNNFFIGETPKGKFDIDYLDSFELRVYCSKDGIFSTGIIQR